MRRPVRDERFTDPEGNWWQILEVGKWRTKTRPPTAEELAAGKPRRPIPCGPYTAAYYRMINKDGETRKINAADFNWTPDTDENGEQTGDPIQGHRNEIMEAVRAGKGTFRFEGEAPVAQGERYHLPCGEIIIGRVTLKTNKRGEKHSEVAITNVERDKVYFLRSTVPAADPDVLVKPPTADDIERARIDGNYLTGAPEAGGDPLPTVPPDWEDRNRMERKVTHLKDRDSVRAEDDLKRQRKAAKATLDATLSGLTPENQQRLLARIISECDAAQMEEAA